MPADASRPSATTLPGKEGPDEALAEMSSAPQRLLIDAAIASLFDDLDDGVDADRSDAEAIDDLAAEWRELS